MKTTHVKIAVLIDGDGNYAVAGNSDCGRDDESRMELARETFEYMTSSGLQHWKFLELDLPIPDTTPINVEVAVETTEPVQVKLGDSP